MLSTVSSTGVPNLGAFNELLKSFGLKKMETWRNNNSTLQQEAYIIDLKNLYSQPAKIISELFNLKLKYKDQTFVAVPVAGWKPKKVSILNGIFNAEAKETLLKEYAQSFSLSAVTTAKNASLILRASEKAQKMEIIIVEDQHFFRVSAGVRITDADKFLFESGYALLPNMPTLHVASLVGAAANGCYGPARNYQSMTTDIVEMKIINAMGHQMTLSANENSDLFYVLRDGHLGTCFVSELTLKIEPKFLMKRHNILFQDVNSLKHEMLHNNFIDKEHFIAMYIPVDIRDKDDHSPRIRITNFERTNEEPTKNVKTQNQRDYCDYLNLRLTETGEPLIGFITQHPSLRQFFPFVLKTAAAKTYGCERETIEIDYSAPIAHVFGTYTDLPIYDINWLIQVEGADDARKLFLSSLC